MILGCPGSEWLVKLGPMERTAHAGNRAQVEEGARALLLEAADAVHRKAAELVPLLMEGLGCPTGCGAPEVDEVAPEVELQSYELNDGKWFCIATCSGFGYKAVCRRG